MGKYEYKTVDAGNIAAHLRPGRHACNCQARVHSLVRNCLGCGRIVCAQEGSGRCFCCKRLVCTREERTIIERRDKESLRLLRRLLDDQDITSVDLVALNTSMPSTVVSLSALGKSIEAANAYKQKLLKADKDQEVTRVNDLQADYFSLEHNPYLTVAEREAIVRRKEELRQLSLSVKKNILVDLDVSTGSMQEQKQKPIETVDDPILQSIIVNSAARNLDQSVSADSLQRMEGKNAGLLALNRAALNRSPPKNALDTLKLKYVDKLDGTEAPRTTEKLGTASHDNGNKSPRRSLQRLFCVALKQPLAGRLLELAMSAKQKQPFCAIPWLHCVEHRGPILVAALGDDVVIEYFNGEDSTHKEAKENVALYQKSAILGKALLFDCITLEEFNREYSEVPFVRPLRNSFVILLTDVEALSTPIPHNSPSEFFAVHRSMVNAVNLALVNGGGVFEETGTTF